jgi:hypothetical protein
MAQRHTVNPRTVLGFYATVLVIVLSGACTLTGILATTDTLTWLIPWLLAFCGMLTLGCLTAIFYINIKHPANLMLGQITGMEYAEISRQTILGNDIEGERTVYIPGPTIAERLPVIDSTVSTTEEVVTAGESERPVENE